MTATRRISRAEIIAALVRKLHDTLRALVPPRSVCAFLDFPNHPNVGDNSIWLGERAFLRSVGAQIVYACDVAGYSQEMLAKRLRDGIILMHGGGNLGDLWPDHQHFREEVITAFPDNKVILLPQTIHFRERASLVRAQAVLNGHPDLTLLVRDGRSLAFARNEFRVASLLCPDMAFALDALERPAPPSTRILWLSRTDIESTHASIELSSSECERLDWLVDDPTVCSRAVRGVAGRMIRRLRDFEATSHYTIHLYDLLARSQLGRGCRILARGRVIVTDRLHGHILSLLLNIPHVVLDNNYGKVRNFYETWTQDCELTDWADSPTDALELARRVARGV